MINDSTLEPCIPPVWARSGHAQTIFAHLLPSALLAFPGQTTEISLSDSDRLVAFVHQGTSPFVILFFHGLNGSTDSDYMQRSARVALAQNHSVVLVNHRGCGAGQTLARGPYHSGRGDDISEVVAWARKKFKQKKIIAVGFSLSANAILTLVSGVIGEHLPDFAIAVNGPIDLKVASDYLKTGFNRIYDFRFVQLSRKNIEFKIKNNLIDKTDKIPFFSHLSDVDRLYTAPAGGFKSADDYYSSRSTAKHLLKIKTPTVLLMSKDDPFIPYHSYELARQNPNIFLRLENVGGHMGYLRRSRKNKIGYERWLDRALDVFLRALTK